MCASSFLLYARLTAYVCAHTRTCSLEGTLSMTSSVKFSAFRSCAAECIQSAQQQCYELLNFIIQLDLISSFHDSVGSPGKRGAQHEFSSPPLPGILFS